MKRIKKKNLERKYSKTCAKLSRYSRNGPGRSNYLKYKKRKTDLTYQIYRLLIPIIENENEAFKKTANENYNLLKNEKINFKTHKQGLSLLGYISTKLNGRIRNNGLIYCKTEKTDLPFFRFFAPSKVPHKLEGRIDCIGNISLVTKSTQIDLVKTLPLNFHGYIDSNGRIKITANKFETDISGKSIISQLVGNPFLNQPEKQHQFFKNRQKLIEMLENFRYFYNKDLSRLKNLQNAPN
jgi:hypothetical protein